jgi:hypothetical protein
MRHRLLVAFAFTLQNVACGSTSLDASAADVGPGQNGSGGAGTGGASALSESAGAGGADSNTRACQRGQVWKPTSARIQIVRSYAISQYGYMNDRSAMTADELAILDELCLVTPHSGQAVDNTYYYLTVVDSDGSMANYHAVEGNEASGNPDEQLDFAPLARFFNSVDCVNGFEEAGSCGDAGTSDGGGNGLGSRVDPAVLNQASAGCLNPVHLNYGCSGVWLALDVDQPGPREFRIVEWSKQAFTCTQGAEIRLFMSDASMELASASVPPPACSSLSFQFDQPGRYWVNVKGAPGGAEPFLWMNPAP